MSGSVELIDVSKLYGDVHAVDRVSLTIKEGEFFSLLGPSGSGKTTCLRLIAGFEPANQWLYSYPRPRGRRTAALPA